MTGWDNVADGYDDVADSALGRVLRARVHERLTPLVNRHTVVLDLGCGTGIDAAWASAKGASVTALDGSERMIDRARRRLNGLGSAKVHDLDSDDLTERVEGKVNVVLANFGVINCVLDPKRFADQVASVLQPEGVAVVVTMARYCPSEIMASLMHGDMAGARRRLGGVVSAAPPLETPVQYYSAHELDSAFGSALRLRASWALGTVLPTFEQRAHLEHRPRLLASLDRIDRLLAKAGARLGLGDHQITVFEVGQ